MTAARRGSSRALCVALLLPFLHAVPARAQDPQPPVRDTLRTPADTLRRPPADSLPDLEAAQDSAVPAKIFPVMLLSPRIAAAGTEWVWDRELLLREADVGLIDLLERIPGITTFRAGTFAQPEVASLFGGTAARTEIELDGYALDPLAAPTLDLSQITLGQLREVRVQRRLGVLRILLFTEYPESDKPFTRIEAGIGVPEANMFRGLFLVPRVLAGPIALGLERIDTDGIDRREPAGVFTGWAKWAWTNGERGVQLEMLRTSVRREADSPWPTERSRQDLVLRGRNRFSEAFVVEAYAGRSKLDESSDDADEEVPDVRIDRSSVQAGVRGALSLPWASAGAALRYRSDEALPRTEGIIDAELRLGPLDIGALAGAATWSGADLAPFATVRAEAGRILGASAFGEVTFGSRRAPLHDETALPSLYTERSGWRAGLSIDLGRASGRVAAIHLDQHAALPFGLPFDSGAASVPTGAADGIEAEGRLILWPGLLELSSWITDWRDADGWSYLPARSWRTALELHTTPLRSGNLEIFGRAEAHMRGSLLAWAPATEGAPGGYVTVPGHTTADGYLQIRIIDVRIFIRWEDVLGADIAEIPGRIYRGPRIFYGVKWNLAN
jgi:hypothetical protein